MSKKTVVKKEAFNTNNAWGFGGAIGTKYTYSDGTSMRQGQACFRHLRPENFKHYYNADGARITESQFKGE